MIPGINEIISHTLCYEDIYFEMFEGKTACKDISLLSQNRDENKLIVVDVLDQQQADLKSIKYLPIKEYDGKATYTNLINLKKKLNINLLAIMRGSLNVMQDCVAQLIVRCILTFKRFVQNESNWD